MEIFKCIIYFPMLEYTECTFISLAIQHGHYHWQLWLALNCCVLGGSWDVQDSMPQMSRVYSFFFGILLKLSFLFANMCVGPGVMGWRTVGGQAACYATSWANAIGSYQLGPSLEDSLPLMGKPRFADLTVLAQGHTVSDPGVWTQASLPAESRFPWHFCFLT